MLTAHRLSYLRNNQILFSGLDLSLASSEILHIIGPNGCGKSTLLHLLTGLLTPEYGEVCWQGRSIQQADLGYRAQVTYIGHKSGIKNNLTVLENLRLAASLSFQTTPLDYHAILHRFSLQDLTNTLSSCLSAGQRQRVALTRLLVCHTPVWILDEPFTSLDSDASATLQDILLKHCTQGGMVALTSHHAFNLPYSALKQLVLA